MRVACLADDYPPNVEDGGVLQKKQSIDIDAIADRKVVFDGGRKVYEWKQSLRKVVIYIEAPPSFVHEPPESDIIVKISPYRLRVGLKGSQSYMIDEETFGEVKVRKSDWYIDGGTITVVLAKKVHGHEWERALGGREKRRTSNSQRGSLEGVISDDDEDEETKDLIKKGEFVKVSSPFLSHQCFGDMNLSWNISFKLLHSVQENPQT